MNRGGFRRLTLMVSIWAPVLLLLLINVADEGWPAWGLLAVLFAGPWLLYFSACYVVKGFRRSDK